MGDFVQVDASVSELREHFSGEYNSRDIPPGDQVEFTTMGQLPGPVIVGLLIQQGCHRYTEGHIPRCPAFE